nr:hypothetical protein [Porphyromonas cangingivalis]
MRRAKTAHSISELEANLLAPMTPVDATSPTAYKPLMEVSPSRLTFIPPTV